MLTKNSELSENIFCGDDIRQQLPAEAVIFEELTSGWKTISSRVHEQKNAIKACHHPGLFKALNAMLTQLEEIQKALAVFLENKRYAFPRFYFISNDDLLEILGESQLYFCTHACANLEHVADNK